MSECPNLQKNLEDCPCTYPCNLKGRCCECIRSHREHNELPRETDTIDNELTRQISIGGTGGHGTCRKILL